MQHTSHAIKTIMIKLCGHSCKNVHRKSMKTLMIEMKIENKNSFCIYMNQIPASSYELFITRKKSLLNFVVVFFPFFFDYKCKIASKKWTF